MANRGAKLSFAMLIVLMIAHLLSGSPLQSVDKQNVSTNQESTIKAVSKRVIHDLHTMAANVPDHCLLNFRFQAMIQSLLEEELSRLQTCSTK